MGKTVDPHRSRSGEEAGSIHQEARAIPRPGDWPLRADHVVERYVDGELVLYDPVMQRVHALNPTAALVWQACDGTHDLSRIVASLAALYPESRREIDADVPETLGVFRTAGLLRE